MKILGNKRLSNESFKKYRQRLKDEKQWIKNYLKGSFRHISKRYIPVQIPGNLTIQFRPFKGITYYRKAWNEK